MCSLVLFFFSSRRRHTRCSRDWSSDVCSSDLIVGQALFQPRPDWSIGLAGSYNVNVGRLDRVEAALDVQLSKEWRFEDSGAWGSFTQSVQNNRVSVTRAFCECMAMSLTYLGARQEVLLEAWLTAIPLGRGENGIGGQGTPLVE